MSSGRTIESVDYTVSQKQDFRHYRLQPEERLSDFNNFWYEYSRRSWPSNDRLSSHLTQRLLLRYPRKTKQAKYALKWTKNVNKFHHSGSAAPNSPGLNPFAYNVCSVMQQRVYRTLFRNVDELKKRLVEVWRRTLSTPLSANGKRICVPVFAQRAAIYLL